MATTASDLPPTYEDAAFQHGELPSRPQGGSVSRPQGKPRGSFPLDIPVLNQLRGKRMILASASPRRKQLLAQASAPLRAIGLCDLEILPSTKPENLPKSLGPLEYVLQTASQKCLSVYEKALETTLESIPDPALVIAADTVIVTTDGRILEKPRSEADHIAMLRLLRDQKQHKAYTAVCVLAPREDARHPGYNMETSVEETTIIFDSVEDDLILAYVKTREGVDMAGGYGMQGMGSLLVEGIEGSFDNAVGLPLRVTLGLMEKAVLNQDDTELDEE